VDGMERRPGNAPSHFRSSTGSELFRTAGWLRKAGSNRPPGLLKKRFVARLLLQLVSRFANKIRIRARLQACRICYGSGSPLGAALTKRVFSTPGRTIPRFAADYEIPQGLEPGPCDHLWAVSGAGLEYSSGGHDAVCLAVPGTTNLTARPAR
jgi:hypothetical protein